MMKNTLFALAIAVLPLLAAAQQPTIWRCGSSYTASPCAAGRALEAEAVRPAADVQAARHNALLEQRLAERLRSERLQDEAAARHSGLAGFRTTPPGPKPASKLRKPQSTEADGTWRAAAPASRRARG